MSDPGTGSGRGSTIVSGAVFVFWVAVVLCLVNSAAFFTLWHFDRSNRAAIWFGIALVSAAASFVGELILTTGFAPGPTRMVIAMAMVGMFVLIAHALAVRYRVELPSSGSFAITAACALLFYLILELPRGDFLRQMLYQIPYALLSVLCLSIIARTRSKSAFDWAFIALFALMAVQFIAKPFVALQTGGVGEAPDQFASTLYAALSISSGAVLLMVLATAAMGMVISDSAALLIRRAEYDAETGLLNRNGFTALAERRTLDEDRAAGTESGADLALMVIAMDGHRPDQVATLGTLILERTQRDAIVGRMADFEFGLLLPQSNLFAARRLAEDIRKTLHRMTGDGTDGLSVSVGITEREPGDGYPDLLARGLWALDEAQRSGGNCVRLAARAGLGYAKSGLV